jgi:hypothetical protein
MVFFVFMDKFCKLIVGGPQEAGRDFILHNFAVKHVFFAHPETCRVKRLIGY